MQVFIKDTSGSTLTITGLAIAMILASAAIAVDTGYAYLIKTRLQGTADSAAIAGAAELPDENEAKSSALAYAALNMPSANHGTVLADDDVAVGTWNAGTRVFTPDATPINAVRVVTRRSDDNDNSLGLFFARALGVVDVNVTRMAIATRMTPACVVALKPNETGILVNSNGEIMTQDCNIHVNSTDVDSIVTNSGGEITVNADDPSICTSGDYEGSGYSPNPDTGCTTKSDPLAKLEAPAIGSCDHSDKVMVEDGDEETLLPGRYCKGIDVNSGGTANFAPGIYIIEGDKFIVNSDSTVQGSGVSFYMRDKDALVNFNQNSHVNLSAPTSGDLVGVLLYVDRDIGDVTVHEINSDSSSILNGAVYMPGAELMINSGGEMGGPGSCTNYIVGNLVVNSDSSFNVGQDFDSCGVPLPRGMSNVRLVR